MRIVDADTLLEKWNSMTVGRSEFDQVIMNAPTVNAIVVTDVKKHESNIFDILDTTIDELEEI